MAITETTPGSPPADDHGGISGPSPEALARGYEEDVYDSRTVLSVPILVILFFVLAFGTVTILFSVIAYPPGDSRAHPGAAERNRRPLNDRLKDNDRGLSDTRTGDAQPRLEPLRLRSGNARAITRPELPTGNSPEIHPEDIRPSAEKFPALYDGRNGAGIGQVMGLSDDALKSVFPTQSGAAAPPKSEHVPTAANAGRGAAEAEVVPPQLPKAAEPKKDQKADGKKNQKQDNTPDQKKGNSPAPAPPPRPKGGKQ